MVSVAGGVISSFIHDAEKLMGYDDPEFAC